MADPSNLLVQREDGIAWLIVDRPEVRNALDTVLCGQLVEALKAVADDPEVRVVILRGAGNRVFISGADVNEFRARLATPQGALEYDEEAEALMRAIKSTPKPVIAMIHGFAIGSGLLVAMACDLRIAADAARVGIPVAKIGLVPPVPDVARLVRLIGPDRAKWLLMSGRLITAAEAMSYGLINHVVPADDLEAVTKSIAATLAANAPLSLKAIKQIVDDIGAAGQTVGEGAPWYEEVYTSADFKEGVDAFFEKRPPMFHGK
ncbi:MAG: enoyl-CoA hydratase-related protein [Proteobacteria bacterium]|nr:enoyl-CoA hydratase-related protein [Pseudomonadota bacterium]